MVEGEYVQNSWPKNLLKKIIAFKYFYLLHKKKKFTTSVLGLQNEYIPVPEFNIQFCKSMGWQVFTKKNFIQNADQKTFLRVYLSMDYQKLLE